MVDTLVIMQFHESLLIYRPRRDGRLSWPDFVRLLVRSTVEILQKIGGWSCHQKTRLTCLRQVHCVCSFRWSLTLCALYLHSSCTFVAVMAQIPLGSSNLDTTRLDTIDVSSPCILLVELHGSTHSTRRARLARHATLLCNLYKVIGC